MEQATLSPTRRFLPAQSASLDERARRIAEYHTQAESHRASFEESAIRAGEELLDAQEQLAAERRGDFKSDDAYRKSGLWGAWLDEYFPGTRAQAYDYMRRAREYRDAGLGLELQEWCARLDRVRSGEKARRVAEHNRLFLLEDAVALRSGKYGEPATYKEIAEELGITPGQAYRLLEGHRQNQRERDARARSAAALKAAETRRARRAVKKAGAAVQEAYAMSERFQDVIAQAREETNEHEARRALDRAGTHYRKMRDEIVCALGALA